MSEKDKEYILWLCKRLIYKYKEDISILKIVDKILEQNQIELSFYKKTHSNISKQITEAISNLNTIKKSYSDSIKNTKNEFFKETTANINHTFENIDFNNLLR